MVPYARAIGVPSQVIVTETNALHSCENLYYSYRLARRLGCSLTGTGPAEPPPEYRRPRAVAKPAGADQHARVWGATCVAQCRGLFTPPSGDRTGGNEPLA
jgi:hypothetical protein